ncbi:hypothetical protein [Aeromicrobium sp. UC242_57]|uniref:hypothetical protein n=1 Tax=Aeromicrobium sp. UC242_57 TaxID=3374624 RepID=UPI0037B33EDC
MDPASPRVLVAGHDARAGRSAAVELTLAFLLLRSTRSDWSGLVRVYVPQGPTVAFSSRDLRRPGILAAADLARSAGFEPVIRSAGGQMVAYDSGAVVIDHVTRSSDLRQAGASTFADNAASHRDVLRSLGRPRCARRSGRRRVLPRRVQHQRRRSGQGRRIGATHHRHGLTVQHRRPGRDVRRRARCHHRRLGGPGVRLRTDSIAGLADFEPSLNSEDVAAAFAADYRDRLRMSEGQRPRRSSI